MKSNCIDETGHTYGILTVLRQGKTKDGRSGWVCKCQCGNEIIVRGPDLRAHKYRSCGCLKGTDRAIDITGQTFNYLTAIRYEYTKNKKQYWTFKCICGREVILGKNQVTANKTKSCGCKSNYLTSLHKRKVNVGETFGLQTVIKDVSGDKCENGAKVLCKCNRCGAENIYTLTYLKHTASGFPTCKNCSGSYKEEVIKNFLQKHNILFQREYSFSDLLGDTIPPRRLRFDFIIFNNNNEIIGAIEYNGIQHYQEWTYSNSSLEQRQKYDTLKQIYCDKNNIPLLILNKNSILEENITTFLKEIGIWEE